MSKQRRVRVRFWPPTLLALAVWIAATVWLGWAGLAVALVAYLVGGVGTIYNLVKSGDLSDRPL